MSRFITTILLLLVVCLFISCNRFARPDEDDLLNLVDSLVAQQDLLKVEIEYNREQAFGYIHNFDTECSPLTDNSFNCQAILFLKRHRFRSLRWANTPSPLSMVFEFERTIISDSLYQILNYSPNSVTILSEDTVFNCSRIGSTGWFLVSSRIDPF